MQLNIISFKLVVDKLTVAFYGEKHKGVAPGAKVAPVLINAPEVYDLLYPLADMFA